MMNPRTYHRNSRLAWPKTTEYACAIEIPVGHRSVWWHLIRFFRGLM